MELFGQDFGSGMRACVSLLLVELPRHIFAVLIVLFYSFKIKKIFAGSLLRPLNAFQEDFQIPTVESVAVTVEPPWLTDTEETDRKLDAFIPSFRKWILLRNTTVMD